MSGQDYPKRLPPGGKQPVAVAGDYIYLKFADRPIVVIADGQRVTMEMGDKYRPGPFQSFEIENPDKTRPVATIWTVGKGDFQRQIVQGEIMVEPGLRRADGSFAADTRQGLFIDLVPSNLDTVIYGDGGLVDVGYALGEAGGSPLEEWLVLGPNDELYNFSAANNDNYPTQIFDLKTLKHKRAAPDMVLKFPPGSPAAITYVPGRGFIYLNDEMEAYYLTSGAGKAQYQKFADLSGLSPEGRGMLDGHEYDAVSNEHFFYFSSSTDLEARCVVTDAEFSKIREFQLQVEANRTFWSFDAEDRRHVGIHGHSSGSAVSVLDENGGPLHEVEHAHYYKGHRQPFVALGKFVYHCTSSGTPQVRKVATVGFETKPELRAIRPGCAFQEIMVQPGDVQVTAGIQVEQVGGKVRLVGEVIRAALEFHFRRRVLDGYLDHVYAFAADRRGDGVPFWPITTGNQSFARALKVDDFDVLVPGQMRITLDNDIELGGGL